MGLQPAHAIGPEEAWVRYVAPGYLTRYRQKEYVAIPTIAMV